MDNITIKIDLEREPIAFISDAPANIDSILCYQHIGQHGEAHLDYMRDDCFPIKTPQDVIKAYALVQELRSIGYNVD